jgi:hypothetical protein
MAFMYWFVRFDAVVCSHTFYPEKLALTSPTNGGRSVGIVRSRTQATEFICSHPVGSDSAYIIYVERNEYSLSRVGAG